MRPLCISPLCATGRTVSHLPRPDLDNARQGSWSCSRQQLLHNLAAHIRKAEVPSLELVSQAGVIQAEQMQNRGLQVVNVNLVLNDVVSEFISGTQRDALLDAGPGQPDRKRSRMVITSQKLRPVAFLVHR